MSKYDMMAQWSGQENTADTIFHTMWYLYQRREEGFLDRVVQ